MGRFRTCFDYSNFSFSLEGKLNMASIAGITLIVVGVVILNLFGPGHGESGHEASETITMNETME